ncbi:MAG: signal recognition particle protein [Alphaproteobacteria bacterium]|nr:signal recognition particle protein [Alphaproteobacteria bacterium]MBP7759470.1 signal recognition particle protein [Alphaproteobacteria bacterium]MBP7762810.1 signal recognition particle protein [Alphaproteobacteria bacterium]MBP7904338.1 signal recognition particle protein [Alphaproteobacteria bacterium]
MFESLSEKLGNVFSKLRGKATLSENDVMAISREIRIALLEADVALPVVKEFIAQIKDKAVGQNIIKGVNPGHQVIKIVHDALVEMLGSESSDLKFGAAPCAYLMVGLQGSGKTTSTAKIAKVLTEKRNKKVLMASLDVYRPAAQQQLKILGEQTGVATLPIIEGQKPLDIAKRAMETGRKEGYDVVMLDTAGRLSIDEEMMKEAEGIQKFANPVETLLVADAMTGQDAVNTAKIFNDRIGLTGIMLTRVDGDARGGAAMSMKAVTGKPIKLIGVGEKWTEIETFHPSRIAGRILGMGDVVSLVERAAENVDRAEAADMARKFKKGQMDFNDLLKQIQQMKKMGGMSSLIKMMPGLSAMAGKLESAGMNDSLVKRQEAIIFSMTAKERTKPELLNASRKKRIAAGSGTTVQEINTLTKQLKQMQTMMKRMRKMGKGQMMGMMKQMMGGNMDELEMLTETLDAESLAADMAQFDTGNTASGTMLPGLGGKPGALPGLGGSSAQDGKKKQDTKK